MSLLGIRLGSVIMGFLSSLNLAWGRLSDKTLLQISANSGETYSLLLNMFSSLFSFHECFLFSGKKLKFVLFIECHTQNPLMQNIYESNQGSTELFIMPILLYLRMFVFLLLMEYGWLLTQNLKLRGNIARDMVYQTPWLPSEAVWLTSCRVFLHSAFLDSTEAPRNSGGFASGETLNQWREVSG